MKENEDYSICSVSERLRSSNLYLTVCHVYVSTTKDYYVSDLLFSYVTYVANLMKILFEVTNGN